MNKLDVYQTLAVFMPGYFVGVGSYLLLKSAEVDIPIDISSIGGSIALLVASYIIGQFVQVFGNAFEWFWRKLRPIPTLRVQKGDDKIVSPDQRQQVIVAMRSRVGLPDADITQLPEREWLSYVGSVASAIRQADQIGQIDVFSAHYGMFRGLLAACVLLALGSWFTLEVHSNPIATLLIVLGLLALYRMDRFDKYCAKELFRQFLLIARNNGDGADVAG